MSDFQANLFGSVENIVDKIISSTPIDLTITAEIVLLKNADIGEYKVKYKGDTFSAKCLDPTVIYKKTEEVYVLVPKGDFSASKVILGKAAFNDSISYADRQTMSNQWKTHGPNWLSEQWYWKDADGKHRQDNALREAGIIATKTGEENLITGTVNNPPSWREYIFDRVSDTNPEPGEAPLTPARRDKITRPAAANKPNLAAVQKADKDFQDYANTFDHVMVSADFETNFSMTHYSGEYGILIECWRDNPRFGKINYPNEPERILSPFKFSFGEFNGAPYQFNQSTPQKAVFPIPKGTLKGLVRVSLFQDDAWGTDIVPLYIKGPAPEVTYDPAKGATPVRNRNNIFAKNIDIRFCESLNLTESLYWMTIDAPSGTTVYNPLGTTPGSVTIPLKARLFYGSEELTSKETCKFIWFRQKYSATMDKVNDKTDQDEYGKTWYDYGGNGWAPIERIMKTPADDPIFGEDDPAFVNKYNFDDPTWHQTLNVGIDNIAWQWRYKVVAVYNPIPKTDSDKKNREGRQTILGEEITIQNTSSIHNFEFPNPEVSNDLLKTTIRVKNTTLPWEEKIPFNPQLPEDPDPAKDWWCRWWMETPSGLYEPVPHIATPRFQKGKISINDYLQYDAITFKAQIFGKRTPTGATPEDQVADAAQVWPWPAGPDQDLEQNEFEIANIERTFLKSEDLALLVDWNGITNHSYNSDGTILLQNSVNSDFSLKAILHWADNTMTDYSIEWIAPDGHTPLKHHSSYAGGANVGKGFNAEETMMQDIWVGADNIVHYSIKQKYDINKTENTYILRVTLMDGRVFEYHKEITFVKAGQNGTQGSDWEARIWPTNEAAQPDPGGGIGFERYTEEIRKYARPLVINGNFDGSGALTRNPNFQLFLRPFIYKNGKRIEELPDKDGYFYKVYWDARYPNLKNPTLTQRYAARNGSFLKFVKFNGKDNTDFDGFTPGETSPRGIDDMQSFTTSKDTVGGAPAGAKTYGALEVQWRGNNTCGTGATINGVRYDTVIRAQVDIFKNGTDGTPLQLATIFSYWPVDLVFTNGSTVTPANFNPNLIKTNWPQFVLYNPTGYAPEAPQDHLRFFYGPKAWNEENPLPFTATPINLTPTVQEIKPEDSRNIRSWRFYPRPYYFFEECANGSMRTDFTLDTTETGWTNPNPDMLDWQNCTFVRPIVYSINSFGNMDINGWDGKKIETEEGTILAPTIGAGYKDPFTNKFNGVIMGIDTSQTKQAYQDIFGGFSRDDIIKRPYMTGLFGYQDGVSSFGIMENGTAYFGRADRGGRIIIDGYNAQIYGGLATDAIAGSGEATGNRDMDMHNRMRLSFIDFDGIDYGNVDPTFDDSSLETDGIRINTGAWDVKKFNDFFCADPLASGTLKARNAGFGSGRGAGTPAIEIGSYKNYMDEKPGNRGIDLIKKITPEDSKNKFTELEDLEIPGYRKFLVTYDGTLYAMNCFVKGNIVGSNIVASNFYNSSGSWWVTNNGNMGVGTPEHPFSEVFIDYVGLWSAKVPTLTTPKTIADIIRDTSGQWTSVPYVPSTPGHESEHDISIREYEEVNNPFFISSDGRVFCREIHVGGNSSINIGGFHVMPRGRGTTNPGDVYSFGTMYLVGPRDGNGTAVEAWGNMYLRGTLTNLGSVFLGGSFEKTIDGGSTPATSQNSPLSITPSRGSPGVFDDWPVYPVKGSFWPLFFYNKDDPSPTINTSWVTLSDSSNRYMPTFNRRVMRDIGRLAESNLPSLVTWRVDQQGSWTDGTLFTNKDWISRISDLRAMEVKTDALAYYGWWKTGTKEGRSVDAFMIKNFCKHAPSLLIETRDHIHIAAGRTELGIAGDGPLPTDRSDSAKVIIEAFYKYNENATNKDKHGPVLSLISRKSDSTSAGDDGADIASLTAGTVALTGRTAGRVENNLKTINSFIYVNGLGFKDGAGIQVLDEKDNLVDTIPSGPVSPNTDIGRIWIKGLGIAIDGALNQDKVTTNSAVSTVRVSRSWDGAAGTAGAGMAEGCHAETSVNIRGNDVQIKTNSKFDGTWEGPGLGNIHIYTNHYCNAANTNEVFLDAVKGAVRISGISTVSLGINCKGHDVPTVGITMKNAELKVVGFTAEQQFGIYARFA